MRKIAYYITDHGFGHATRAVALIRHLQTKYAVFIRNDRTHNIFKGSLESCHILEGKTDAMPILLNEGLDINEQMTNHEFLLWMEQVEKIVEKEVEFLRKANIDLVISDISCMPFLAAKRAGIRSVGISNFTWVDILHNFENKNADVISRLEEGYSCAEIGIELTGSCGLKGFKEKKYGGLLCREISESRSSVRRMLGIEENETAVLLTFGGSVKFDMYSNAPDNYRIVVPSEFQYSGKAMRIPVDYYEMQNVVGAMDSVVSKAGYGIVSECMQAGVPILMACKKNSIEDAVLSSLVSAHALGAECALQSILDGSIFDRLAETLGSACKGRIKNGNVNCMEIIDSILR